MTMMDCWLIRLEGDETWADLGDKWTDHVEILRGWPAGAFTKNHYQAPQWIRDLAPSVKLDWGATLHPIGYENLKKLISEANPLYGVKDDDLSFVSKLDSAAQYAVVWVEEG